MRYERAFGLRENPFRPLGIPNVARKLTDNLVSRPILVHRSADLEPLYVASAGPFKEHVDDFKLRLEEAGYDADTRQVGGQSMAVLIVGPHGTGKSTLRSVMLHELLKVVHGTLDADDLLIREVTHDIDQFVDDLAGAARAAGQPDSLCPLVIENVTRAMIPTLVRLFNQLLDRHVVLLIMESSDRALLNDNSYRDLGDIVRYDTDYLTGSHAKAYVEARLAHFRLATHEAHLQAAPLFPFRAEEIGAVAPPNGQQNGNAPKGQIGLRQLNQLLSEALRERVKAITAEFDLLQVPAADLDEHCIALAAVYEGLVA